LVGVVGDDYPLDLLQPLVERGVDLAGLEKVSGSSFRWRGRYRHDLNAAETLETHLGVFSNFRPNIPDQFREAPFVFLANIDPRLQLQVLEQVKKPRLVACDTMNFWIESRRPELVELLGHVDLIEHQVHQHGFATPDPAPEVEAPHWLGRLGEPAAFDRVGQTFAHPL